MMAFEQFEIQPYQSCYAREVSELFHLCVHSITHVRYAQAQLMAWSAAPRSAKHWDLRLSRSKAWVVLAIDEATASSVCCGFINVETHFPRQGYLDSLYIHPDYQGQGLGEHAYLVLEAWAKAQGYVRLSLDASYLSKGLFTRMGFIQIQHSYQQKLGQVIPGFYMEKNIGKNI
ncbi:GNAT family N-acetyltransferase [Shewanella sp. SW32]|uniref:GNAT family N-acetyltransferase n=1 Tax=unclassified Shewanella TaxID=196818 RepID=UPI0021D88DA1|nr:MULTISPECIES: GNAT family N-acetyltransferase [unclassified Shewanella]MCU7963363.1 GNAT family N-acetyltransferase [Shewanella sp. SW32]MCU7971367.1 GNAT family N-acetyltransferase [Shewanella sp. SW29]